jgi:hypothetical protein
MPSCDLIANHSRVVLYLPDIKVVVRSKGLARKLPLLCLEAISERGLSKGVPPKGEPIMLVIVLLCLARTFLPDAATLAAAIETQAALMAFGVFAFLLYRVRLGPGSRLASSAHTSSLICR